MGTHLEKDTQSEASKLKENIEGWWGETPPTSFDSRTQWPDYIHPIRDQAQCGSCWAFAASEVFSDRLAIQSKGAVNEVMSPQDLVSCDSTNLGCNGGVLSRAWKWIAKNGICSDACYPYVSGGGDVPACSSTCTGKSFFNNPTETKYNCNGDAYSKSRSWFGFGNTDQIKLEIKANGPVETGFTVYKDFMSYKSGIYVHTTGSMLGGHAVKIVGWGQQDGTNYWIVANSWGTSWGMNGYFYIKEGQCGIDRTVWACTPNTTPM